MSRPINGVYRFEAAAQWEAGVRRNLVLDGDLLVAPEALRVEPIPGTGPADGDALPAVEACGRLSWLRTRSRELVRLAAGDQALTELGVIDHVGRARGLEIRPGLLWLLTDAGLERFALATLQRLSPIELGDQWEPVDLTGDGGDGVWVLEVDRAGRWQLRSFDCWGRASGAPIELDGELSMAATVASTADGRTIVVIDESSSTEARVVDVERRLVSSLILDPVHATGPTLLTVAGGALHLLTTTADPHGPDDGQAVYEVLSFDGDVEDHQWLDLPSNLGRPGRLVGGGGRWWLFGACGVGEIVPDPSPTGVRWSTFVTPTLVSPQGVRSGWNRAEVDVQLPVGTTLEVSWAATASSALAAAVDELLADPATAGTLDELDRLLTWNDEGVTYRGHGPAPGEDEAGSETLAALLDRVELPYLWLRLRLETPPTRVPPTLSGLRVHYPDTSYLDHLPAIYRESPPATHRLRQLLAPFEVLFDQLDRTLGSLPDRIDPATASDDWSSYLLGWLGFPPLLDLPADRRGAVLHEAPDLLDRRGTVGGLRRVLHLVTAGRATVTDAGNRPAGWVLAPLPSQACHPTQPGGLGIDTVALAQRPEPSRPGTMTLGHTPLGRGCPDPAQVLADRAFVITVQLELTRDEQELLEPIIERLLPFFVPAHCRVDVIYTGSDGADRTRRLDVDFRLGPATGEGDAEGEAGLPLDSLLHGDGHWRLGSRSRVGRWTLPDPPLPPLVLDHRPRLSAGPRLH